MSEVKKMHDDVTLDYKVRTSNRNATRAKATMVLLQSFITDGDSQADAKLKVQQLSQELTQNYPGAKGDYDDGDTALLKTAVQASNLAHMTQAKKDLVINILNLEE